MKTRVDWLGLCLAVILCLLTLYIIGCIPKYPSTVLRESFLASAGTGVMVPPSKIKCSKVGLNATPANSMVQSGGKTWLCADQTNANKLVAGDTTLRMAYISRNDIICVAQDGSGTIYTCMDPGLDPYDESPANEYMNYTTSCNAFYVKYLDISNALTTLQIMQTTILGNQSSLQESQAILDAMHKSYKCDTMPSTYTEGQKKVCNAIVQARSAITSNVSKSSSLGAIIMESIRPALQSRTDLIKSLREYHCEFDLPVI
jgi:hypothetical protein